jgi:hypothetical protein
MLAAADSRARALPRDPKQVIQDTAEVPAADITGRHKQLLQLQILAVAEAAEAAAIIQHPHKNMELAEQVVLLL